MQHVQTQCDFGQPRICRVTLARMVDARFRCLTIGVLLHGRTGSEKFAPVQGSLFRSTPGLTSLTGSSFREKFQSWQTLQQV